MPLPETAATGSVGFPAGVSEVFVVLDYVVVIVIVHQLPLKELFMFFSLS